MYKSYCSLNYKYFYQIYDSEEINAIIHLKYLILLKQTYKTKEEAIASDKKKALNSIIRRFRHTQVEESIRIVQMLEHWKEEISTHLHAMIIAYRTTVQRQKQIC